MVDYVRSSYRGRWRLFRDRPDIVTRGRYVFVPTDTANYPGPHNFWSETWTHDAATPYVPPPLGESLESPRVYDRGSFPFALPPAATSADPLCIAQGEAFPPREPTRIMLAGYAATCWTDQGRILPMRIPELWFTPEAIPPGPAGAPFPAWIGAGLVPDTLSPGPLFTPTLTKPSESHWWAVRQLVNQGLLGDKTLPVGREFETFGVWISRQGSTSPGLPTLGGGGASVLWAPAFLLGRVRYRDTLQQLSEAFVPAVDRVLWWRVKRELARVRVWVNGVLVIDGSVNPLGTGTFLGLAEGAGLGASVEWLEVMAFVPQLLPWEEPGVLGYLSNRYGF